MALNLQKGGHHLFLHSRSGVRDKALMEGGGTECTTPAEVATATEFIITMLPNTPDVEAVLFGENGVASGLTRKGKLVIDMSSIAPLATKAFAQRIRELGADYLDAPLSGGDAGAKNATLTIMVGGGEEAFGRAKPLFELMGNNITLVGANGDGQTTKVANQFIVALTIEAVSEALVFAAKAGADPAKGAPSAHGWFCVLPYSGGPRRTIAQAELRARISDQTPPEGSGPRPGRRKGTRCFLAEYRDVSGTF